MSINGSEWQRVNFAFGDELNFLREDQGLLPEEFALLFEMDEQDYLKTETGEGEVTLGLILRIANGLACKPEKLVTATLERMPGIDLEARIEEAKIKRKNQSEDPRAGP